MQTAILRSSLLLTLTLWLGTPCHAADKLADLRKKAEAGDKAAQRDLGNTYDFGHGVRKDPAQAARWYQMAADQGDPVSQNNLASLYEHGLGVSTNYNKAFELYTKSAQQGFAMAQNSLGRMYEFGRGTTTNLSRANDWYLRAANQGSPEAMFNLAINYGYGYGLPKDRVKALMWLDLARFFSQDSEDRNFKAAVRRRLDDLKELLTPDEIKQGNRMSKEWYEAFKKRDPNSPFK